jgi:hypothetical protein
MNMNLARSPIPSSRRNEQRDDDAGHPLEKHELRKELVCLAKNSFAVLLEKLFGATAGRFRGGTPTG